MNARTGECLSARGVEMMLSSTGWPDALPPATLRHAEKCDHCQGLLQKARDEEQLFLSEVFPKTTDGLSRNNQGWAMPAWAYGVAVTAAALALVLHVGPELLDDSAHRPAQVDGPAPGEVGHPPKRAGYVGIKASPNLLLYVRRGTSQFRFDSGTTLQEGDRVRLRPIAAGSELLLVLHRDSEGTYQVVYPWDGAASAEAPAAGDALAGSVQLDSSLGSECFAALFSSAPLAATAAERWFSHHQEDDSGSALLGDIPVRYVITCYAKETK